jgi:hypothetical protein
MTQNPITFITKFRYKLSTDYIHLKFVVFYQMKCDSLWRTVFFSVTPCGLVDIYWCFGETSCLHLPGRWVNETGSKIKLTPKRGYTFEGFYTADIAEESILHSQCHVNITSHPFWHGILFKGRYSRAVLQWMRLYEVQASQFKHEWTTRINKHGTEKRSHRKHQITHSQKNRAATKSTVILQRELKFGALLRHVESNFGFKQCDK